MSVYEGYNSKIKQRAVKMLQNSITVIEQNGWCTGEERKPVGQRMHYCAVGALAEASKNFTSKDTWTSKELARYALDDVASSKGYDSIVELNDNGKSDKRTVLRAFNKAIENLTSV